MGVCVWKRDGKWGYVDKIGRVVSEPQWEDADDFREGLACVKRDGKWGVIDKTGRLVIEPQWEDKFYLAAEGLSRVKRDGKYGFIDKTGRVVIEPQWDVLAEGYPEGYNAANYYLFARQEENKVVVVWLDSKAKQIWSSDNQSH